MFVLLMSASATCAMAAVNPDSGDMAIWLTGLSVVCGLSALHECIKN